MWAFIKFWEIKQEKYLTSQGWPVVTTGCCSSPVGRKGSHRTPASHRVTLRAGAKETANTRHCAPQHHTRSLGWKATLLLLYQSHFYPHSGLHTWSYWNSLTLPASPLPPFSAALNLEWPCFLRACHKLPHLSPILESFFLHLPLRCPGFSLRKSNLTLSLFARKCVWWQRLEALTCGWKRIHTGRPAPWSTWGRRVGWSPASVSAWKLYEPGSQVANWNHETRGPSAKAERGGGYQQMRLHLDHAKHL